MTIRELIFVLRRCKGMRTRTRKPPITPETAADRIKGYEKEREALLIWLKRREIGWKKRAAKKVYWGAYGRAAAYEDVWRQILFPGKSVQDGTLSKEDYSAAVAEWEAKADIAEEAGSETS